ncbi:hypothetical protein GUJ93_ZPchr0009g1599 [Zizania palustris]|uniref:Uncharacterized protein n=1 Tax=Zizania palustris TaxID=103762 RepID=A0A8J5RKV7_ZIZPA|nr:hypothetical protein GUJ93_ZPchr0009g1599 [Zizania palustris]
MKGCGTAHRSSRPATSNYTEGSFSSNPRAPTFTVTDGPVVIDVLANNTVDCTKVSVVHSIPISATSGEAVASGSTAAEPIDGYRPLPKQHEGQS